MRRRYKRSTSIGRETQIVPNSRSQSARLWRRAGGHAPQASAYLRSCVFTTTSTKPLTRTKKPAAFEQGTCACGFLLLASDSIFTRLCPSSSCRTIHSERHNSWYRTVRLTWVRGQVCRLVFLCVCVLVQLRLQRVTTRLVSERVACGCRLER